MPTQFHLPVQPGGAEEINAVVARVRERGQVAYFASGVPVFVHADGDPVGQRIAAVQLRALGLARPDELSAAFAVNRSTLYRQGRKLATAGVLGVVDGKRGPRGPHRFTPDKWLRVTQLLGEGVSIRQAAQQVGVTEGTIRHALRRCAWPSTARRPARQPRGRARAMRARPAASRCSGMVSGRWRAWGC
jgi:DNA-binding NarL/FixJ family response regulator